MHLSNIARSSAWAVEEAANRFTGGENGGVVFVTDDLGAWLAGLLGDHWRKKLTTMVP